MPRRFDKRYDWGFVLSSVRKIVRQVDWRAWGFGSVGVLAAVPASAQGLSGVDAGALLRQEEMKQREIPRELPRQAEQAPLPMPAVGAGDLVSIKTVRFEGDLSLLPENERRSLVADAVGKELVICPLLSGPKSILGLVTKEEWNGT